MKHVLIVEDHPLFREGLVQLLQHRLQNCEIVAVGTAEQGLERLAQTPRPDAIVLDLNLPGMDGLSALACFADRFQDVPVIVISGDDNNDTVERAMQAGARAFIPKSLPGASIVQAIEQGLTGYVQAQDATYLFSHVELARFERVAGRPVVASDGSTGPDLRRQEQQTDCARARNRRAHGEVARDSDLRRTQRHQSHPGRHGCRAARPDPPQRPVKVRLSVRAFAQQLADHHPQPRRGHRLVRDRQLMLHGVARALGRSIRSQQQRGDLHIELVAHRLDQRRHRFRRPPVDSRRSRNPEPARPC